MVAHFAKGLALQRRDGGGWYGHVKHGFRSTEALVHVAPWSVASTLGILSSTTTTDATGHTSGELHEHPVRLDGIVLDELDQDTDVHVAGLDHLGEDEALCVRLSRHARARGRKGGDSGAASRTRGQAYLFDICKGRLHDGGGSRAVVNDGRMVEGRRMAETRRKSLVKRKSDSSVGGPSGGCCS